jgi:hypothetical protein
MAFYHFNFLTHIIINSQKSGKKLDFTELLPLLLFCHFHFTRQHM